MIIIDGIHGVSSGLPQDVIEEIHSATKAQLFIEIRSFKRNGLPKTHMKETLRLKYSSILEHIKQLTQADIDEVCDA